MAVCAIDLARRVVCEAYSEALGNGLGSLSAWCSGLAGLYCSFASWQHTYLYVTCVYHHQHYDFGTMRSEREVDWVFKALSYRTKN